MRTVITLKNVSKVFHEKDKPPIEVLEHINLEITEGEFFVILGPSGSGKSTLLRIASGLEKSYEGQVLVGDGVLRSEFSFVFQQFALLPWLTVSENIGLGLVARHVSQEVRNKKVSQQLRVFGLEKFANVYPRELSGGMRQRVGIARALATNPKIIFMDEPFSELDSFTAEELRKELLKIWQERKITIIMVTHLVGEALELADRIAVLTPRPGRIEKVLCNNLPRPRNKRCQEFYELEDRLYRSIKP